MQFEKCLTCASIKSRHCAGPNYMAMSAKELVSWIIEYQRLNGITNAQLAEASGIPKGTIDGIRYRADVRHDTIYPLLKALIELTGGVWGGEPCVASGLEARLQNEKILQLEEENQRLDGENKILAEELQRLDEENNRLSKVLSHKDMQFRRISKIYICVSSILLLILAVDWVFRVINSFMK